MQDLSTLHSSVINSLEMQIAVVDHEGTIVDINSAWIKFGADNGLSPEFSWIGASYLDVLSASVAGGDNSAREAAQGIVDVMSGKRDSFYLEYPCHSKDEKRWFMMRVIGLKDSPGNLFVISHHDITQRKLAEERAQRLALYDPLTGLANRRYFNDFLKREVQRSFRNQAPISLLEVDVDNFKEYNDEYGHPTGDKCLIKVGRALQELSRRPSDLAARIGGDEFALILGDTDAMGAQNVANAVLKAITDLGLVFGDSRRVTASVGAASMTPGGKQTEEFLVQEADKALYSAKSAGRNLVVHAQPG